MVQIVPLMGHAEALSFWREEAVSRSPRQLEAFFSKEGSIRGTVNK